MHRPSSFFPDEGKTGVGVVPGVHSADRGAERAYAQRPNAVEEILQRDALVQSARDLRVCSYGVSAAAPHPSSRLAVLPPMLRRCETLPR